MNSAEDQIAETIDFFQRDFAEHPLELHTLRDIKNYVAEHIKTIEVSHKGM